MTKASSRLGKQLEEAIATLDKVGAKFALIGGLALAPHRVVRATQGGHPSLDPSKPRHAEPDRSPGVFPPVQPRNITRGDSR